MIKIKLTLFISILPIFYSCQNERSDSEYLLQKYGAPLDSMRKLHFLPVMSSDFKVGRFGYDFVEFRSDNHGVSPGYTSKIVFWDKEGVYLEKNYIFRSNSEYLNVYSYLRKVEGVDTVGTIFWYRNKTNDSLSKSLNLNQVDSLLKSWDFVYLK